MKNAPLELKALLDCEDFKDQHDLPWEEFKRDIERFLASTMDEVRTSTSRRLATSLLEPLGIADLGMFREAVLRRELTGVIAYQKQRDHSSHTIYNYLLGWYFYSHCNRFRDAIHTEFDKRGVKEGQAAKPFSSRVKYFGCVWQYTSLLHDVGYMFEGGIPNLDDRTSSEQAAIGAKVAWAYFSRRIWLDYHSLDLRVWRSKFFEKLGDSLDIPHFNEASALSDIADVLRSLGNLDKLSASVAKDLKKIEIASNYEPQFDELSVDAFELWSLHYKTFGCDAMAKRMRTMRRVFNALIDDGLPGASVRVLDHGVCSGLLLLLATTYYYRIYAAAKEVREPTTAVQKFLELEWSPAFWWTGIVWATAATAVHNIQQMKSVNTLIQKTEAERKSKPEWKPLELDEDPLAYLGVLVDSLEEWDRYSVFKSLDREPIQGTEVDLGNADGKITVKFLGPDGTKRAEKLRTELNEALAGWESLLDVAP